MYAHLCFQYSVKRMISNKSSNGSSDPMGVHTVHDFRQTMLYIIQNTFGNKL